MRVTLCLALVLAAGPSWARDRGVGAAAPKPPAVLGVPLGLPRAAALPVTALQTAVAAPQAAAPAEAAAAAGPSEAAPAAAELARVLAADDSRDATVWAEPRATAFDGGRQMRVVQAASEMVPFVKTGGLADVTDGVGRGMAARGHIVTSFLPDYSVLNTGAVRFERLPLALNIPVGHRTLPATFKIGRHENMDLVLVENPELYHREGPYYYLDSRGKPVDYADNDERFIFFARAVMAASSALGLAPDIIHAHDWQTALIPAMMRLLPRPPGLMDAKTALSLHNLAFQGNFPYGSHFKAGFSDRDFTYDKLEFFGNFGFLKAGIQLADILTTVSRNYAREIQEDPEQGMGYEGLLRYRAHDLHGIPNRIDYDLWNPATDRSLQHRYSLDDVQAGKAINKIALQPAMGLSVDASLRLFGVASRLSYHKGIDMIADAVPELVELGVQLAIVGNAAPDDLERLNRLKERYSRHLGLHAEFSETMARKIFAASDFFLMPSRLEPCGISQMIAQRYGSRPIVAPRGGLLETVKDAEVHEDGDGFFMREISTRGLVAAVKAALGHPDLARVQRNGMTRDNSWGPSVAEYEALFRRLIGG